MTSILKNNGSVVISIITAIAIIASAFIFKNTEYENTWLWIFVAGSLITAFYELWSKKQKN